MLIYEIKLRDVFSVILEEIPSTGCRWEFQSNNYFEVMGIEVQDLNTDIPFDERRRDGKVIKTFHLKARVLGEHSALFLYRRPWDKLSPPIKSHSVRYSVI